MGEYLILPRHENVLKNYFDGDRQGCAGRKYYRGDSVWNVNKIDLRRPGSLDTCDKLVRESTDEKETCRPNGYNCEL